MRPIRQLFAVAMSIILLGTALTGVGIAQQGPPDDAGPPDGIHDSSLVVTEVTVDKTKNEIAVTVANPGKQSVSVSRVEFESVQPQTVVTNVATTTRSVVADLNPSNRSVVVSGETTEVLDDIQFEQEPAIQGITVSETTEQAVTGVPTSSVEVVERVTPETTVLKNVTGVGAQIDSSGDIIKTALGLTSPISATQTVIDFIQDQATREPIVYLLVETIDVVGEGDTVRTPVVQSVDELERHPFLDHISVQAAGVTPFLKRPGAGETVPQPPEFKSEAEVVDELVSDDAISKISWTTPSVVSGVTSTKRPMPVTLTSVWDAAALNGSASISLRPRQEITLRLDLNEPDAPLAGTPPSLPTARIIDGWLYDENGNELAHFLAEPGS